MRPKFGVAIESPDHFTLQDKTIGIVVRAKYTHGKPVRGKAVVSVDVNVYSQNLAKKILNMDSREIIKFDSKNDLKLSRIKWFYSMRVN